MIADGSTVTAVLDDPGGLCGCFGIKEVQAAAHRIGTAETGFGRPDTFGGRCVIDCTVGYGCKLDAVFSVEDHTVNAVGKIAAFHPVQNHITDSEFTTKTVPESYAVLRDVKKYPFGSSFMQPKLLAKEISSDAPVSVIENDCVIVCGSTQLQAYDRLEVLENSAKTLTDAISLGGRIVTFNGEELEDIKRAFGII